MNPSEYQRLAARTECDQMAASHRMHGYGNLLPIRLNHSIIGALGELGEMAGALERWIHYDRPLDRENLKEEIGDVLWYLAEACNALEIDMGEVMEANIRKLKARYPDKYSDERAAEENRNREAERVALGGLAGFGSSNIQE